MCVCARACERMCVCARARARACAMMYEYVSIPDEPANVCVCVRALAHVYVQ